MITQIDEAVTVVSGTDSESSASLAGMTVGQLRETFCVLFTIPPDAVAMVRGKQVGDDYVAQPGDLIEFARKGITKATR